MSIQETLLFLLNNILRITMINSELYAPLCNILKHAIFRLHFFNTWGIAKEVIK